jgi:hypothetical protein
MPEPAQGRVEWFDRFGDRLVVSSRRTLEDIVAIGRARGVPWIVVRMDAPNEVSLWFVCRRDELEMALSARSERAALPIEEALDLAPGQESMVTTALARPLTAALSESPVPCASRLVHLDADGRPDAIGQVVRERSLGRMRGGRRAVSAPAPAPAAPAPAGPPPPSSPATVVLAPPRDDRAEPLPAVLSAEAPSQVAVGQEVPVDVMVALAGHRRTLAHAAPATLARGESVVAILTVQGDAVVPLDPRIVRLSVPGPGEESTSAFMVRGAREGTARVAVIFRQGGTELATVVFSVRVAARVDDAAPVRRSTTSHHRDPADDRALFLLVNEERSGDEQRYRFQLVAPPPMGWDYLEFFSAPLKDRGAGAGATPRAYVQSIYDRLGAAYQSGAGLPERDLRALGSDLGRQLFPPDLTRELWAHRDDIRTVHVKSWEPFIPWELVRLRDPDPASKDGRFLCEYDLVRSLNGNSRPRDLRLDTWRYLVATYPNGLEEPLDGDAAVFTDTLAARHLTATPIAPDPAAIFDALEDPDFDVLHICCHGRASHDDIDRSALIVGDRPGPGGAPAPVTLDDLTVRAEARLSPRFPLVFLNACESGRLGASLTAWGGWPRTFWDAGAGAFVGTSWPVEDTAARAFCAAFYGSLLDGKTLAEAGGAGRRAAREKDPATALAYKVYGDPGARRPG